MKKDGKYDYIDKTGKNVIAADYTSAKKFSEGLARVYKGGKYGYIDKTGKVVIPFDYDFGYSFVDGVALVEKNDRYGLLKNKRYSPSEENNTLVKEEKADLNALYSKQNITVNGELIKDLEVYNIDGHNFFKLRDIAKLADNTDAKFSVDWNGEKELISLKKGENYTAVGSELMAGDGKDKLGIKSTAKLEINGETVALHAYTIENQNYYEIRPLGNALGFTVEWNDESKTVSLGMNASMSSDSQNNEVQNADEKSESVEDVIREMATKMLEMETKSAQKPLTAIERNELREEQVKIFEEQLEEYEKTSKVEDTFDFFYYFLQFLNNRKLYYTGMQHIYNYDTTNLSIQQKERLYRLASEIYKGGYKREKSEYYLNEANKLRDQIYGDRQ